MVAATSRAISLTMLTTAGLMTRAERSSIFSVKSDEVNWKSWPTCLLMTNGTLPSITSLTSMVAPVRGRGSWGRRMEMVSPTL
jgi:hypothetical protein